MVENRKPASTGEIVVRLYAGVRLYDTSRGKYVSVDDLRRWQAERLPFRIEDAATGADITRVVLA